jgi:hypothetical protein
VTIEVSPASTLVTKAKRPIIKVKLGLPEASIGTVMQAVEALLRN